MVGIKGVGGIPEPTPDRPANVRDSKRDVKSAPAREDGVRISPEAQEAASSARLAKIAREDDGIRADKVAAAKERIERGDFRFPEVVAEVARRLSKYLP
ncbi:MAG: flagellar biosynthesis anti-sigma factor FlgM [Candidatus Hydrogenedentota bacterium]